MRVTIRPSDWSVRGGTMGPIGGTADRLGGEAGPRWRAGARGGRTLAGWPLDLLSDPLLSPLKSVTCVPLTRNSRPAGQLVLRPLFCSMYHSRRECSEEGRLSRDRPTG